MGFQIDRENFTEEDFRLFSERLRENLADLEALLARPDFGEGDATLGAELEVSTVDERGRPMLLCNHLLGEGADPRLQAELDCFNLEYNLDHVPFAGRPFSALQGEIVRALATMEQSAAVHGGRIVTIGILPTLREDDLQSTAMSDSPRFRALSAHIRQMRGCPFSIRIDGPEPLSVSCTDVTMEGANNSFQVHWRVPPLEYAALFNAAQVVTAPVLALCANSPFFLGHRLWDETRVALFKQAVDTRGTEADRRRRPPRVLFGTGWVRRGAMELFSEAVALFPPLLPLVDHSPERRFGDLPMLRELTLHLSSVWQWNRPVYDSREGGHLRIELRALPSGPTPADMVAGAAFLIGAAVGLRPMIDRILPAFPFSCAARNFTRAAQQGLDALLSWPVTPFSPPEEKPAREILGELLPLANEGLSALGVAEDDCRNFLGLIRERLEVGRTPARWQQRLLARLEKELPREKALEEMLRLYMKNSATGVPVARWSEELP